MTDQLLILDVEVPQAQSKDQAPRCRMCARAARWLRNQQAWAMYCAGKACNNRDRICQKCGGPFTMNVDGAGTKYCSAECKTAGYHPPVAPTVFCAWCDREVPRSQRRPSGISWPFVCRPCLDPIWHVLHTLKAHRVPHQKARQLVTDPGCEVCDADLLTPVKAYYNGKPKARLTIDHDHACCPGNTSCGRCVRGFLCGNCNSAAGQLRDSPENAALLSQYLARWVRSSPGIDDG